MSLTAAQQRAVAARGNVLVMAGAGTGKTRTVVERCLDCLLAEQPRVGLEEILLVTFTEAAAAEMRQRIRARLEQQASQYPDDIYWQEQLALFETAKIGTLHSFCLQLVRQHFYELELDPQLVVLPEEEAKLLAEETLEELLLKHYEGTSVASKAVQQIIIGYLRGSEQPLRNLVLKLHRYSCSLPNPEGWRRQQSDSFASEEPAQWRRWFAAALEQWRETGILFLSEFSAENPVAKECLQSLRKLQPSPSVAQVGSILSEVLAARDQCPKRKTTLWLEPLKDFFAETAFLRSLTPSAEAADPLKEDWDWIRQEMKALIELTEEFSANFSAAKRELGVVDFSDLEQYALKLLWDQSRGCPTEAAKQWRQQLRFLFVDEYQDINAAQDRIIQALSREGEGNRFLVGDVKQSIYRFRLANPHIFQGYIELWRKSGQAIALQENFRSRGEILAFVNSVCETWMIPEVGGLRYDEEARLVSGLQDRGRTSPAPWAVELRLRLKGGLDEEPADSEQVSEDPFSELEEAAKEARLVGARLKELVAAKHPVWDEENSDYRPVEWRDIVILLRSPANKAASYAKEFALMDLPLQVARTGFYDSIEISDLLSLMQMLDNPLQDIPVLAVLRSPFVALTLNELAEIRLTMPRGHFWLAVLRWAELHLDSAPESSSGLSRQETGRKSSSTSIPAGALAAKLALFLKRFDEWRKLARQVSLSECLERILTETKYADWLATVPRAGQRLENLKQLMVLAERFDQLQRQGLFRFLRFIEAQRAVGAEPEVSTVDSENTVRLMSIHQSKGLEFPVVVLADVGKAFNLADLRAQIILDEQFGLSPLVQAPNGGQRYPSLPHWLAARRQHRELLGEELRLFYVAMTRARDLLLLSGSTTKATFEKIWHRPEDSPPFAGHKARSIADWLGAWFRMQPGFDAGLEGANDFLRWHIHDDAALASVHGQSKDPGAVEEPIGTHAASDELRFDYPFLAATRLPAKTSVSIVRRQAWEAEEGESGAALFGNGSSLPASVKRPRPRASAADVGTAHHVFLEHLDLSRASSSENLRQEAVCLQHLGKLTEAEHALLDFTALAGFWGSELGARIRKHAAEVRREVPFTFRLPAEELASLIHYDGSQGLEEDFVVVQGVADLVVVLPKEIWLLDFKTERARPQEDAVAKYRIQMRLYSQALAGIYQRPVTEAWLHLLSTGTTLEVAEAKQLKGNSVKAAR